MCCLLPWALFEENWVKASSHLELWISVCHWRTRSFGVALPWIKPWYDSSLKCDWEPGTLFVIYSLLQSKWIRHILCRGRVLLLLCRQTYQYLRWCSKYGRKLNVELRFPELPVLSSGLCTESSLEQWILGCRALINLFSWGFGDIMFWFYRLQWLSWKSLRNYSYLFE